jgi:ClpP class serine protease
MSDDVKEMVERLRAPVWDPEIGYAHIEICREAADLIQRVAGERDAALAALREIARQRVHAEITDTDPDELDWLGGYEACVRSARAALTAHDKGGGDDHA